MIRILKNVMAIPFVIAMLFICMVTEIFFGPSRSDDVGHWGIRILDSFIGNPSI